MRKDQLLRCIFAVTVIACTMVWLGSTQSVSAQSSPPYYSHSWYVNNVYHAGYRNNTSAMYDLGYSDGQWDTSHCTNSFVVLDFGQVGYYAGNFGTYYYASGYPFISDSTIVAATEDYAMGWYAGTLTCPYLTLALGTNNYRECPYGCNLYAAGQNWASAQTAVQNFLTSYGMSGQIAVASADDMEVGWDSAASTRQFVDGYNATISSGSGFFDYGDAWSSSTWQDSDVYYVAWEARTDRPLPEIYISRATTRWMAVKNENLGNPMVFSGVMAECHDAYPLPETNSLCSNPSAEYIPYSSWVNLWNQAGQPSLEYATNIKFQGMS